MTQLNPPQTLAGKNYLNEGDIFKSYTNEHELTFSEFKFILKTFFIVLSNYIIYEGNIFKLPNKLGRLGIIKKYGNSSLIDFNLFKQGIVTKEKNTHTHNYSVKFKWMTEWPHYLLPASMCQVFRFKAPRNVTRELAKHLKSDTKAIFKYYDY